MREMSSFIWDREQSDRHRKVKYFIKSNVNRPNVKDGIATINMHYDVRLH